MPVSQKLANVRNKDQEEQDESKSLGVGDVHRYMHRLNYVLQFF